MVHLVKVTYCLGTPTSLSGASLALIVAAPSLLGHTPSCLPICKSSYTIVWLGSGCTANLSWASFPVDLAAPRLLAHSPTSLPIDIAIRTVVRICWPDWLWWHDHRWLNDWWLNDDWRC